MSEGKTEKTVIDYTLTERIDWLWPYDKESTVPYPPNGKLLHDKKGWWITAITVFSMGPNYPDWARIPDAEAEGILRDKMLAALHANRIFPELRYNDVATLENRFCWVAKQKYLMGEKGRLVQFNHTNRHETYEQCLIAAFDKLMLEKTAVRP